MSSFLFRFSAKIDDPVYCVAPSLRKVLISRATQLDGSQSQERVGDRKSTVCAEWTKEQLQQRRVRNLDARACYVHSGLRVKDEFACSISPCVPSRSPQENHQYSHMGSTYLCKSTTHLLITSYLLLAPKFLLVLEQFRCFWVLL